LDISPRFEKKFPCGAFEEMLEPTLQELQDELRNIKLGIKEFITERDKLIKQIEERNKRYPCIKISRNPDVVIYFIKPNCGYVIGISPQSENKLFEYSTGWCEELFTETLKEFTIKCN